MKKYTLYILIIITLVGILSPAIKTDAVENCSDHELTTRELCLAGGGTWAPDTYKLLTPLPNAGNSGPSTVSSVNVTTGLGTYINLLIKLFIGICAVLSMIMIVVGGLEYMTSDLSHSKEAGRERIRDAIFGLLIALGAYALLYTINPELLKSDVTIPQVTGSSTNSVSSNPQQ